MTKTSVVALAALLGLLAGCGGSGDDDTDRGTPQAADGGCEADHQTDNSAWQPAAQLYDEHQTDSGVWQPPTEPYPVGESFTVENWTIAVSEIDYDATNEVEAAIAEQGLSYDGTPIEDWTWVVAEATLTYGAAETASPDVELESRYVDRDGEVYIDFQCDLPDNFDGQVRQGQTATLSFGVPVPPEQVDGGFWGIGPASDPEVSNLTFVR